MSFQLVIIKQTWCIFVSFLSVTNWAVCFSVPEGFPFPPYTYSLSFQREHKCVWWIPRWGSWHISSHICVFVFQKTFNINFSLTQISQPCKEFAKLKGVLKWLLCVWQKVSWIQIKLHQPILVIFAWKPPKQLFNDYDWWKVIFLQIKDQISCSSTNR